MSSLPEKRNDLGQDLFAEPPPEKRAKLDDPQPREVNVIAMELQSNSNSEESKSAGGAKSGKGSRRVILPFCEICYGHVGHKCWDCPNRSKGIGLGCPSCLGPCKVKDGDPNDHWEIEIVKYCVQCGSMANHWVDECPFLTERPPEKESYEFVPF